MCEAAGASLLCSGLTYASQNAHRLTFHPTEQQSIDLCQQQLWHRGLPTVVLASSAMQCLQAAANLLKVMSYQDTKLVYNAYM
jgi:hypothetical protein